MVFFVLCCNISWSQQSNNIVQIAHNMKWELEDFTPSSKKKYKTNVFTVTSKSQTNKTHHWFLQLLTADNHFVNYGNVTLKGYLKDDPSIAFRYMGMVENLCTEGKYLIGFVKVKEAGTYVLDIEIDNFGEKDRTTVEINIPSEVKEEA